MLYPKMNQARTVIDLSGVWEFKLGTDAEPGAHIDRLEIPEVIAVPTTTRRTTLLTGITMAGPFIRGKSWCRHI